jgi:hypothetical protein
MSIAFWYVTLFSLVEDYALFGGIIINFYQTARLQTAEDNTPQVIAQKALNHIILISYINYCDRARGSVVVKAG